ncbi:hypothetical protein C8J56DRAFT_435061 [Mycena floridula]|nr:hypothetical protein C8J56DRAFT_435061 [Mycena floridula]
MVLIDSIKYACETCIKGHRSSACKHTSRPLFEIQRKGRPVTQCEHCRELRKTKQVHVKCICEVNNKDETACKKGFIFRSPGITKTLESAAFPNGLPEALEASVALQFLSEASSSDSDHGGQCTCKAGGDCHCCTPRKTTRKPANRRKGEPNQTPELPETFTHESSQTPAHILARVAELRPVLPKPPKRDFFVDGPAHDPSSRLVHGHRHHEDVFFSPYGRAYDYAHIPNPVNFDNQSSIQAPSQDDRMNPPVMSPWAFNQETIPYSSVCGCGPNCGCPGCLEHNNGNLISPSAVFPSCMNPETCGACLNCALVALQGPLPPDNTSLGVDDWLRQLSADAGPSIVVPSFDESQMLEIPRAGDKGQGLTFAISGARASSPSWKELEQGGVIYSPGPDGLLRAPELFRSRSSSTSSESSEFSSGQNSAGSRPGSSLRPSPVEAGRMEFSSTYGDTDFVQYDPALMY